MLIQSEIVGEVEVPDTEAGFSEAALFFYDRLGHLLVPPDQWGKENDSSQVLHINHSTYRHPADLAFSLSHPAFSAKNIDANGVKFNTPCSMAGFYVDEEESVIMLSPGHLYNEAEKSSGDPWFRARELQPLPGVTHRVLVNPDKNGEVKGMPQATFINLASNEVNFPVEFATNSFKGFASDLILGRKRPVGRFLLFSIAKSFSSTVPLLKVNHADDTQFYWVNRNQLFVIDKDRMRHSFSAIESLEQNERDKCGELLKKPTDKKKAREVAEFIPDLQSVFPVLQSEQLALSVLLQST